MVPVCSLSWCTQQSGPTINNIRIKSYPSCSRRNHPKWEVLTGPCPSLASELHYSWFFLCMGNPSAVTDTAGVAPAGIMPEVLSTASWCCTLLERVPPPETKGSPKRCSPTPHVCKNKWINDQSMGTCSSTHLTPPGDLLKCSGLKKWWGLEMLIHVDNGMKQILRTWGSPSNSSATEHLSIKSKKQGWETRLYKNGGVRHKPPVRQMALPGILHPCASPEVSGSLKFQGNCTELVDFKPTLRIWKRFILIAPWQISSAGGW